MVTLTVSRTKMRAIPFPMPLALANPTLHVEIDTLVGTLDYGPVRVATGSMGSVR